MLTSVLATQRAHFAAIAKSWLTSGASAFGVWSNGAALASWPDQRLLDRPSLAVPIAVAERVVGVPVLAADQIWVRWVGQAGDFRVSDCH